MNVLDKGISTQAKHFNEIKGSTITLSTVRKKETHAG